MAIIRWRENPITGLDWFSRELNRFFGTPYRSTGDGETLFCGWCPSVDIYEDEQNVVLTAELPGIDQEDVKVSVEDDELIITGERKFEHEDKQDNYHRVERSYGSFSRRFTLTPNLDGEGIIAKMDKGVLTVTVPKKEEAKPKQIEVKVN